MIKNDYFIPIPTKNKTLHILDCYNQKKYDRIIVTPPLVGGSSKQQIIFLRYFVSHNIRMISLDYSGHNASALNSKFSIDESITETEALIKYGILMAKQLKLPLHVMGNCYSVIPSLLALNSLNWTNDVTSLVSFNGLFDIKTIIKSENFLPHLRLNRIFIENELQFVTYLDKIKNKSFNNMPVNFKKALIQFITNTFPELKEIISEIAFGELPYSNVKIVQTLKEFLNFKLLDNLHVPEKFNIIACYGTQDTLLQIDKPKGEQAYINKVRAIAPHAKLLKTRVDHFCQGPGFYHIREQSLQFMKDTEGKMSKENNKPKTKDEERLIC